MTIIKDVKNGALLPEPIYNSKPFVWYNKDGVILGSAESIDELKTGWATSGTYYDDCVVDIRKHDLYMSDNSLRDGIAELRRIARIQADAEMGIYYG